MFSPFQKDLSEYTIPELENKIQELSKKYWISNNPDVQAQIATFLDIYKVELQVRLAKEAQKNATAGDDSLDNLINVS